MPTPDSAPHGDLAELVAEVRQHRDVVRRAFLEARFLAAFSSYSREMGGPWLAYDAGFVGTFVDEEAYR